MKFPVGKKGNNAEASKYREGSFLFFKYENVEEIKIEGRIRSGPSVRPS